MSKLSADQIKAVAEAAIAARNVADAAKAALDESPDDESLQTAYQTAERTATEAKAAADALSQDDGTPQPDKKVKKIKRRIGILRDELKGLGVDDDENDDDDDTEDDLDRPVTRRELAQMEQERATRTAFQMAETELSSDPVAKKAVTDALSRVVPSGDPAKDFADAVAIANREKNSKILEEIARRGPSVRHSSGAGAPPAPKTESKTPELTAEEKGYLLPPFNMTAEQIVQARGAQQ